MRRSMAAAGCLIAVAGVLGAGCGSIAHSGSDRRDALGDPSGSPAPSVTVSLPSPSPLPPPSPSHRDFLPAPNRPVPTRPGRLASELTRVTVALRRSIDRWAGHGDTGTERPPRAVVLQALYQQRIYRELGRHPELARRTVARMPPRVVPEARNNTLAQADLFSLLGPIRRPRVPLRTQRPLPPGVLLRYYRQAQRRFGVSWAVLAAVNLVESKFGRVRTASAAGAQGPMQFLPSTWRVYGLGGDIHDPHDAILGAANYLHASGAPRSYRRALYAYNHAFPYVNAVLLYTRHMLRRPHDFVEYYNWQVFVITPSGERRLTGPRPR